MSEESKTATKCLVPLRVSLYAGETLVFDSDNEKLWIAVLEKMIEMQKREVK